MLAEPTIMLSKTTTDSTDSNTNVSENAHRSHYVKEWMVESFQESQRVSAFRQVGQSVSD